MMSGAPDPPLRPGKEDCISWVRRGECPNWMKHKRCGFHHALENKGQGADASVGETPSERLKTKQAQLSLRTRVPEPMGKRSPCCAPSLHQGLAVFT
jgi:hypothetical protein